MKSSRWHRITIRRLMLVVAVVAVLLVGALPLWRYWFGSPIRRLVVQWRPGTSATTYIFDVRHPAAAKALERMRSRVQAGGIGYRIDRSRANPEDPIGSPSGFAK